jgi:hypothetical protein
MVAWVTRSLTSRAAGLLAWGMVLSLTAVLAVAWNGWTAERQALEARLAELTQQGERSQSLWRAQLAACHATAAGSRRLTEAAYARRGLPQTEARALLEGQPEGIDACARMESADHAVLSNLR